MRYLALGVALALGACGEPKSNPDSDTVVLETELGKIVIDVDVEAAPVSGGDFLKYVDEGLYRGEGFYRTVTPETDPLDMGMSLVQGGVLSVEPATPPVAHERTDATGLSNMPGSVALARNAVGTGSAAFFFINIGDNSFLDAGEGTRNPDGEGYAVFGQVVDGMDVVKKIQARETAPDVLGIFDDGQKLAYPVIIERAYRQ